jgi:hypothetical protein
MDAEITAVVILAEPVQTERTALSRARDHSSAITLFAFILLDSDPLHPDS